MLMFEVRKTNNPRSIDNLPGLVALFTICATVLTLTSVTGTVRASDPSPVNPPGEIPAVVFDTVGNVFEVFTPREGGTIVGDGFSFEAQPGDVPSASLVAVRMTEDGPASNAGITHHRYTFSGNYYIISAVDGAGKALNAPFTFRNPPVACVPIPGEYLANIDAVRLIATDPAIISQTVLTSSAKLESSGLKMCGYVGTVPTAVAVGIEGSPGPVPPTPVVEVQIVELPVTGGAAPTPNWLIALLVVGVAILVGSIAIVRSRIHRTIHSTMRR